MGAKQHEGGGYELGQGQVLRRLAARLRVTGWFSGSGMAAREAPKGRFFRTPDPTRNPNP